MKILKRECADDSCWILAERLALENAEFRIWMGDAQKEEVFCGDPKGITQRLLKMPLLFLANFPLSHAAILGSREGGSQFKWPDITHGFTQYRCMRQREISYKQQRHFRQTLCDPFRINTE